MRLAINGDEAAFRKLQPARSRPRLTPDAPGFKVAPNPRRQRGEH